MPIRIIFRSLLTIAIVVSIMVLLLTWYKGYHGSIESILSVVNTRKNSSDLSAIISEPRFRYIQFLLVALIAVLIMLLWKFKDLYNLSAYYINSLIKFLKTLLVTTIATENKYLLIVPIGGIFYYAIVMPVCYDEGLTYLYFTSKGFLSSLSFYPEPNNHILHSLLTNLTIHLPFGDTEFRLRLPALTASIVTWMLSYKFLLKYYNRQVAMIVTATGSMIFMVFYYNYQSRGYAMVNLFFIACMYNAYGIMRKNDSLENWVWFGISSILGFYTIPSFLYPFITLNLVILLYNRPNWRRQFITNAIVTFITVALYLPVIIVNGLDALTNNPWVKPIARNTVISRLPSFLKVTLNELTQFPWWLVFLMFVPSFIYALVRRQKFNISLFLIFLLAPPVFMIAQSVIPFPRTFGYYGFILPFLAIISFAENIKKIPIVGLTIALIIVQLGLLYLFDKRIIPYEERDPQLNWTVKKLTNEMVGNKRYFSSGNLLGTTLLYELRVQGYPDAKVIFANGAVNADTVKNFDYIILGNEIDQTKNKKPLYVTEYFRVY